MLNRLLLPTLLSLASVALAVVAPSAFAQTPSGKIEWNTDGKPALNFAPKAALGLYVKKTGNFHLSFFADALSAEEERYFVARQAAVFQGKFEGKPFKHDAAMNAKLKEREVKSVSLWGGLADLSKTPSKLPAVHEAKDLKGLMICVGHDCNYYSGGTYGDEFAAQVKSIKLPTPAGAAAKQTASLEVAYKRGNEGAPTQAIALKGDLPFYVVHE